MVDNVLLKIIQILILIAGLFLLGILFYNIIFLKLTIESRILRIIIGIIGLAIWTRFLVYVIRKFKKYF
ncbi:hypothetical protein [Miniphocaeibacter massiliensis]|uniref:hypothetical protein n=1 Tax=Miniphocaeibacter massiliensis TaxID=2041841 RepID=UPI000C1BFA17|nr:hypothetical protein [Miniphocaeibacter massiliensis]